MSIQYFRPIFYPLGLDMKERMAKQRQLLNARLGLDIVSKIGIELPTLFTTEDLVGDRDEGQSPNPVENCHRKPLRDVIYEVGDIGLSSREKNRAKRKARQAVNKQKSREPTVEEDSEPDKKKTKTEDKIKDELLSSSTGNCQINLQFLHISCSKNLMFLFF